ncbi:hypothetical protein GCM10010435_32130 [Winogradskya consettensis]|uniref:Uncharacterized protein n=1 Tax=Winogradskya consettensis TaxID=113560 RepID=A0A919SD87_9ACTN|nr:hypothetical protein Aco04nite_19360 [Actinoplanes consettensis]
MRRRILRIKGRIRSCLRAGNPGTSTLNALISRRKVRTRRLGTGGEAKGGEVRGAGRGGGGRPGRAVVRFHRAVRRRGVVRLVLSH